MRASDIPTKVPVPFGASALPANIRAVPNPSQLPGQPGNASFTDGFPPDTLTPPDAGGIPPDGRDFNGLFNQITAWTRWANAGAPVAYDAAFATAAGGYPQGAVVSAVIFGRYWVSTVDSNVTNPDSGGAGWAPWPLGLGPAMQTFYASGVWVAPPGVVLAKVRLWGAGGPGGNGNTGGGGGGAAGGYSEGVYSVTPGQSYAVTLGAGGVAATSNGGTSYFGTLATATGGGGGGLGPSGPGSTAFGMGTGGSLNALGESGGNGLGQPGFSIGGGGGSAFGFKGGQAQVVATPGTAPGNNAQAGSGGAGGVGSGTGGTGGTGLCIVEW